MWIGPIHNPHIYIKPYYLRLLNYKFYIKKWIKRNLIKQKKKKTNIKQKVGYINNIVKPYKGNDGYLHCSYCRRRCEPGHTCEKQYK